MDVRGFVRVGFNGVNGAGPISVPGMKVGDVIIWVSTPQNAQVREATSEFESIISVVDEIQQLGTGNFTTWTFDIIALRGI